MKQIFPYILIFALLATSCAKVVSPVGGPKDTTPPAMVKESPSNKSVHFDEKQIKITFDEFFTLNKPSENVLISPPLKHEPEYKIKNKSLIIKFQDTLKPNTTYNIIFSNCIQDYHESNKLGYYHYSFATGEALDSFMVKGMLVSAEKLTPSTDFFVFLYKNGHDSLPMTSLPDYVTKSLSDGSFTFSNIANGNYMIFALKDINANLIYDLPNEEIAFCDQFVTAMPEPKSDTSKITTDSDKTSNRPMGRNKPAGAKIDSNTLVLYTFTARDTLPQLQRYILNEAGIYQFPYKNAFNQFEAKPLINGMDYFQIINDAQDTVTWYMKQIPTDTMKYILTADGSQDTVLLKTFKAKPSSGRGARSHSIKRLGVSFQNTGDYFKPITLSFSYPVRPMDSFPVFTYSQHDTLVHWFQVPDSFIMTLPLEIPFDIKKNYTIVIPDSTFFGYNGLTHDTLRTKFTMKSEKDYGNLMMTYTLPEYEGQYVVQLWKENKIYQKDILTESQKITYSHLEPGNYKVRLILDKNKNGRWDKGNYLKKEQPEKTIFFQTPINIRAFWDVEEEFIVK